MREAKSMTAVVSVDSRGYDRWCDLMAFNASFGRLGLSMFVVGGGE